MTEKKKKIKNLRRPVPFMTRFNADERARFDALAHASGLTLQEYSRCRLLYIPFTAVGGREPKPELIHGRAAAKTAGAAA